jgi:hypothetical protein
MQVKGKAFTSALEYAEKKYGCEKVRSFFLHVPEYEQIKTFSDLNWYDMGMYMKFSESIDKFFGFGDASLLFEIGEYSAKKAFESSHRLFKDLSMQCALSNAQSVFLSYFSAGVAEIKYLKDNKINFSIKNLPVSPYLGRTIHGWMKHAARSIKASDTNVVELDAKACLCYSIEWSNLAG